MNSDWNIVTPSTAHMSIEERQAGVKQMVADLTRLADQDGCIAAAWALEVVGLAQETRQLLEEMLPLAMGASCFYDDHPEADRTQHCCDWSGVVEDICDVLGREKPEDDAERCERVRQEGGELWRAYWRPEIEVDLTKLGPREFVVSGGDRGGHFLLRPLRAEEGEA